MKVETILIATRNIHKAREIRSLLSDLPVRFTDLTDYNDCPDVIEDQDSLEGNALKKVLQAYSCTGLPALADDTGLEVHYLLGKPGVFSARFAGENVTYDDNNQLLLQKMRGVPTRKRTARFRTVVALAGIGDTRVVEGSCNGTILFVPRGTNGFGYDPLFQPEGMTRSYAELSSEEKNAVSHRSRAILRMKEILQTMI